MLQPGSRLATYEVGERLAVGGMGEVYLCRYRLLDRIDAVKVLRPHIVTVYTADEVDGQLYLAMEPVPGADLAALIKRDGGLEPRSARWPTLSTSSPPTAHRWPAFRVRQGPRRGAGRCVSPMG